MKKETRVKDLPEILKSLCAKVDDDIADSDLAKPYFDKVDWQSVTDAERLAYCEVRYPIGTKCKSLEFTKDIEEDFIVDVKPHVYYETAIAGKSLYGVLYCNGKFAEIIEEVETIKEAPAKHQDQFVKANPDMSHSVEFKEGEMVITTVDLFPDQYEVVYQHRDKVWLHPEDAPDFIINISQIRKIDPDKEIKQYAKEIMKRYIERDDKRMELMLIEAMKKVQSKK